MADFAIKSSSSMYFNKLTSTRVADNPIWGKRTFDDARQEKQIERKQKAEAHFEKYFA